MNKTLIAFLLIFIPHVIYSQNEPAYNARYRVTFESDWSANTHPSNFPSNSAHFSGLIGATHSNGVHLWQMSELSSPGIKLMAETGSKSILNTEINSLINNQQAQNILSGGGIGFTPGNTSLEFDASQSAPLVSLVSMIAPSPDWFIGVDGLNLRQSGQWQEMITAELQAYDAGTDSGTSYTSGNQATNPPETITKISQTPFNNNVPLGRFVFELISTNGAFPLEGKHSGLYYDPNRSGEGINVTIAQNGDRNFIAMTWYTYRNNQQMWLIANGDFNLGDESINMEVFRTDGASFGMDFDSNDVNVTPWGNVTISIPSCNHLNMAFTGTENPAESGQFEYTRLANVQGLECE